MSATYTQAQNIVDLFDSGCKDQAHRMCQNESIATEQELGKKETIFVFPDDSKVLNNNQILTVI